MPRPTIRVQGAGLTRSFAAPVAGPPSIAFVTDKAATAVFIRIIIVGVTVAVTPLWRATCLGVCVTCHIWGSRSSP